MAGAVLLALAAVVTLAGLNILAVRWLMRHINTAVAGMCACIGDHDPEPDPVATSPEPAPPVVARLPTPDRHREAA